MASFYFVIRFKWADGTLCESIIYNDSIVYRNKFIDQLKFMGATDITHTIIRKEKCNGETQENG